MTSYEFEVAAKNAVIRVVEEKYGEKYTIPQIHIVFFAHVLGNKKATLNDSGGSSRYYDVTLDLKNNALYVDVYEKVHKARIFGEDIDVSVS